MRVGAPLFILLILAPVAARAGTPSPWAAMADGDWGRGSGDGAYLWGLSRTELRTSSVRTARDEILGYQPLWQTLRFGVRDDGPARRFSFETSLRGGADLRRGGFAGEAQILSVELAPAPKFGSLKLGRQFVVTGNEAGLLRIDGARGQLLLGRLGLEGWGGVPLRTDRIFAPEGQEPVTGWAQDWAWGASIFLANHASTQGRLGWSERFRSGEIVRRALTIDLHQGIRGRVHVRANLAVDALGRKVSEFRAGVDGLPTPWMSLSAQFEAFEPTFDADEVWSVFRTDPFHALTGSATLRAGSILTGWVGGGVQILEPAVSKDDLPFPELGRSSAQQQAGLRLTPVPWLSIEAAERLVAGTGGEKVGLDVQVRVKPLRGRIEAGLRGTVQRYGFDLQPTLGGTYGSLGADIQVSPASFARIRAGVTGIFSPFLTNDVQVFTVVDFLLGVHPRARVAASSMPTALLGAGGPEAVNRPEHRVPGLGGGIGLAGSVGREGMAR